MRQLFTMLTILYCAVSAVAQANPPSSHNSNNNCRTLESCDNGECKITKYCKGSDGRWTASRVEAAPQEIDVYSNQLPKSVNCKNELSWVNAVQNIDTTPNPKRKAFCQLASYQPRVSQVSIADWGAFTDGQRFAFVSEDWIGFIEKVFAKEDKHLSLGYVPNSIRNISFEKSASSANFIIGAEFKENRLIGRPFDNTVRLLVSHITGQVVCVKFSYIPCHSPSGGSGDVFSRIAEQDKARADARRANLDAYNANGAPGSIPRSSWPAAYLACMVREAENLFEENYRLAAKDCGPRYTGTYAIRDNRSEQRCLAKIPSRFDQSQVQWHTHHPSCKDLWK